MQTEKGINLYIGKLELSNQKQQKKVNVNVYYGNNQKIKSSVKKLKKGIANFYRETFELPEKCKQIIFKIIDVEKSKIIYTLPVETQIIQKINFQNNAFCSVGNGIKIQWEAIRLGGFQCHSTVDTHKQNFQFIGEFQKGKHQINLLHPALKIRQKRKISFKTNKNSQAISQPSQKGQRILQFANFEIFDKNNKNLFKKQNRYNILTEREKQKVSLKQQYIYGKQIKYENKNNQKQNKKQSIEKATKQVIHRENRKMRLNSPNKLKDKGEETKMNSLKRSKSELFLKIGLRQIISTTLFGIAAGFAATQI